ncbi:hypothetical protein DEO72_LG5g2944 [Vigna unguiculata]|uniref:TF-B3 domain-containing protein n=1 Tax=Vigna unguiculata TaxID=3917 RepID=A0A4D6M181_VIGUN|nr:hypothetical protein DEO72_LG5g2944 [Vigna unguiculata]
MAKCLSAHDIKSSSLYLESAFASKALVKNRKRHLLVNAEGDCWPCTVRWSGKTNKDCYITRGWKDFCTQNGFKEGSIIQLGVDKDLSLFINVMEVEI